MRIVSAGPTPRTLLRHTPMQPFRLDYAMGAEPSLIMATRMVPWFDERIRGEFLGKV